MEQVLRSKKCLDLERDESFLLLLEYDATTINDPEDCIQIYIYLYIQMTSKP